MKKLAKAMLYIAVSCTVAIGTPVLAEAYPTSPIKFIVPFNAGGGTDVVSRIIAESMSDDLGQPVVVDNRPGAHGIVGTKVGATAKPNGYAITFVLQATMALNPSLHKATNYDPIADFEPISQIATVPYVVVVHPSLGANSVQELVAIAKQNPGTIDFASGAAASYLASLMFQKTVDIDMAHIPYSGSGQALSDVMAGRVKVMLSSPVSILPHIRSGKLIPLAVTSPQRIASLPDVPTIAELGYPGFDVSGWYGIAAPKGTPHNIIEKLNASIQNALSKESVQASLAKTGVGAQGSSPEQFKALIASEQKRWSDLIREVGIEAQ